MKYRVSVEDVSGNSEPGHVGIKVYEQIVAELDIVAVMQAVNRKPRKPRVRKEKPEVTKP